MAAELVSGSIFNSYIPENATAVVFEYNNSTVTSGTQLSTRNSPVPIYGNLDGTTWRVSTSARMINANPDCSYMFSATEVGVLEFLPHLGIIDFGDGFNTRNVTNMENMFACCEGLINIDLSVFNTSNVTDMDGLFVRCTALSTLDLSGFNTSSVRSMADMFAFCWSLENINLSGFNTSNVTNMTGMFMECWSLTSIDVSSFNTSNVTDMDAIFSGCSGLTSLNLSNFNTSNVGNMDGLFMGCSSLTSLNLSNFDMRNVDEKSNMCWGLSTTSGRCTITCTEATQTALENGADLPTSGVEFTWVRPSSK